MANLTELEQYDAGIYQIESTDFVAGGANGVTNTPLKQLANRTKWIKATIDAILAGTKLTKSMVGLANVDNTTDLAKPVSTATNTALASRVAKAGEVMTGSLVAPAFGATGNSYTRIANPAGGAYSSTTSSTGAIKITLPQTWTNTMMSMSVRIFNYVTGKSFDVFVAGYLYEAGAMWYNTSAYIISGGDTNYTVRFGHDGTKCCVYIGETTSTWKYLGVTIIDFQAKHMNYEMAKWDKGWSIGLVDAIGTITATHTNVQVGQWVEGSKVVTEAMLLAKKYVSPWFDVTFNATYPITHNLDTDIVKITVQAKIVSNPSAQTAIGKIYEVGEFYVSYDNNTFGTGVIKQIDTVNSVSIKTVVPRDGSLCYVYGSTNSDSYYANWTTGTANGDINHAQIRVIVERI